MKALVARGADVTARNEFKSIPLNVAATFGVGDVVEYLITITPRELLDDKSGIVGRTSLHWAVYTRNDRAIRALIAAGANPDIPDIVGETARECARERGREHLIPSSGSRTKPAVKK